MFNPPRTLSALVVFGSVALFATSSMAVLGFVDGNSWHKTTHEYQYGYAAGAVDMLRALEDARLLASPFSKQAHGVVQCLAKKTPKKIVAVYDGFLKREPKRRTDSVASVIYLAVRSHCHVK